VISLHGYGGSIVFQNWFFNAASFVHKMKFILAMPSGISNGWDFSIESEQDQEYLLQLITDIKKSYPVDSQRVYLIGHSNGGILALNFACKTENIVAAVMPVGAFANYQAKDCAQHKLPTFIVHGALDEIVHHGLARFTFKKLRRINNCDEYSKAENGHVIANHSFRCEDSAVSLYTLKDATHAQPIPRNVIGHVLKEMFKIKTPQP